MVPFILSVLLLLTIPLLLLVLLFCCSTFSYRSGGLARLVVVRDGVNVDMLPVRDGPDIVQDPPQGEVVGTAAIAAMVPA